MDALSPVHLNLFFFPMFADNAIKLYSNSVVLMDDVETFRAKGKNNLYVLVQSIYSR